MYIDQHIMLRNGRGPVRLTRDGRHCLSGEEEMHAAAKEFRVEKLVRVKPAELAPLPPAKLASSSATRILI